MQKSRAFKLPVDSIEMLPTDVGIAGSSRLQAVGGPVCLVAVVLLVVYIQSHAKQQ